MSVKTNHRRKARQTVRQVERAVPATYIAQATYLMAEAFRRPAPVIQVYR